MDNFFPDPFHQSGEGKIAAINLVEEHNLKEIGEAIAEPLYAEMRSAPSPYTLAARKIVDLGPLNWMAFLNAIGKKLSQFTFASNLWSLFKSRRSCYALGLSF